MNYSVLYSRAFAIIISLSEKEIASKRQVLANLRKAEGFTESHVIPPGRKTLIIRPARKLNPPMRIKIFTNLSMNFIFALLNFIV